MPEDEVSQTPPDTTVAEATPTTPIAPKKRKKLTKKEERLARSVVSNPNGTLGEHADKADYAGAAVAWKTLQRSHVKDRIRELMNKRKDTSLDGLHKTLSEGLKATDTKFFARDGEVIDERTTVDHATRHRYLETALELHGALEKEKDSGNTTNNFFTKEAIETFVAAFKGRPQP